MRPFLEVESINQKSAIHTKSNSSREPQEIPQDHQDPLQTFNTLMQATIKKDFSQKSNLSQTMQSQQRTRQFTNAKDLLYFSSTQKHTKTLKDLSEVAKNLQINLKNISIKELENTKHKGAIQFPQHSQDIATLKSTKNTPKASLLETVLNEKLSQKSILNTSQEIGNSPTTSPRAKRHKEHHKSNRLSPTSTKVDPKTYQESQVILPNNPKQKSKYIKEALQQPTEQTSKQDNFLNNLLKTDSKLTLLTKDTKEFIKEKDIQKDGEKSYLDSYQQNIHSQREMRFTPQSTFTHFGNRLKDAILNYRPPMTKITLELHPQHLGDIDLTITKNGDQLSVQIRSNQTALQLIMQNTQEFKNILSNLGFQNIEIDFKDNQNHSLTPNFGNSNQQGSGGFQQWQEQNKNTREQKEWNENGLQVYEEASNPYTRVALMEMSFSYYA